MTRTRRHLDAAGAQIVATAAEQHALEHGYRVVIVVVDAWGDVLTLKRTDDTQSVSWQVAIDKARTAAIFVRPSRDIEEQVSSGRYGALALQGAVALTGGIPLVADGEVVGAIGTSGETPDEDEAVSKAGAAASFTTQAAPALSRALARRVSAAVGAECARRDVHPVVAVVDEGGVLVDLWRPDGAQVASVGVATDKARTAAIYRRPSKDFEDQATGGRPSALHLARSVPLQGGLPIVVDGHVIGAVGVSGATSADEDQELAGRGIAAAEQAPTATYLTASEVTQRFATGGLLFEAPQYKVDAGRRTGGGPTEVHADEADVLRVVEGTATVEAGDATHELAAGDVLVVPAGVPHTFTTTSDPFLYYVVKSVD